MSDLTELTIADIRDGLGAKKFSATELTDAYLEAIAAHNARFNAFIAVTPEIARDQAKASDARIASGEAGAREGVPIGIKDLYCRPMNRPSRPISSPMAR